MSDLARLRRRGRELLGIGWRDESTTAEGEPLIAIRGDGAWVEDLGGQRFVDWNMGFGALALGYRHPEVDAAVRAGLAEGTIFSFPHRLEIEVAELLCSMIPCAEKVAFGKNGSDVCTAAVRIARAVTGRDAVLQCGYHGFHDWTIAANRAAEGVPAVLRGLVHPLVYGDLEGVRGIFAEHAGQIAAVILEPMRETLPPPGWLEGLRELTQAHGALLVFDEMVTGFRVARGGAQSLFGVTPDLACFGKALANGLPLSALVGRADLIDVLPRVAYGMTMRGETLALAAARATLRIHARADVAGKLHDIGRELRDRLTKAFGACPDEVRLSGHPAMQTLIAAPELRRRLLALARASGIFSFGHFLPCMAHGAAEIELSAAAFAAALRA